MTTAAEIDQSDWHYLRRTAPPSDENGPRARMVDLFAGCGGMSLGATEGLRAARRTPEIALAVEISLPIRAIYDANFVSKIRTLRGDVFERFNGQVAARTTSVEAA